MKKIFKTLSFLLFLAFGFWVFANQQFISDYIQSKSYSPNSEIQNIADRVDFTDKGLMYFYANSPSIESSDTFNDVCDSHETTVSVLGCYDGKNIYLYNVTREELDGIKEVTAAHETLHAAFDRLSSSEKDRIAPLLEQVASERLKTDSEFAERMGYYTNKDASQKVNELHSILGTEMDTLPDELEKYYSQYFNNRKSIAALYDKYNEYFTESRARIEELNTQMEALSAEIKGDEDLYTRKVNQLKYRAEELNKIAQDGSVSASEFYNMRNEYNQDVAEINQEYDNIQAKIDSYNKLVEEYNQIGANVKSLQDSMNSNLDSLEQV